MKKANGGLVEAANLGRRRRHRYDHQPQEHAVECPGQGVGRDRPDHRRPDRLPRQPRRGREEGVPRLRRQDRHLPRTGAHGLALRGPGRGRDRDAQVVRPQKHHRPDPPDPRPDLCQHPRPRRQDPRPEGRRDPGDDGRDLQDLDHRGPRRAVEMDQGQGQRR